MLTIRDFSTALYGLSKAKGYAATVIVTLGVTLGALVAMFNLNYQIIAAPLPYQEADKLLVGSARWLDRNGQVLSERTLPQVMLQMYHQPSASLTDHGLFAYAGTYTLRDLPDAPLADIAYTTPGFMRMYQMPILQGRAFDNTEELDSQLAVAVISERFWREHYQADPAMLERQITVDDRQFRVVGIAGAEFKQPDFYGPMMGRLMSGCHWILIAPCIPCQLIAARPSCFIWQNWPIPHSVNNLNRRCDRKLPAVGSKPVPIRPAWRGGR